MQTRKKLNIRMDRLRYVGYFTLCDAREKNMRLVVGREGKVSLYLLVDESDGMIADAKFQAFGPIILIAAADAACELILRKNYDQASRISADLLEHHLGDRNDLPFSKAEHTYFNQVISAIDCATQQCIDIPLALADYDITPIEWEGGVNPEGLSLWENFSSDQKLKIVEEVIDKEIRPYIELDAGGIKIVAMKENGEIHIAYEGACTTCPSSIGSTLSAIEQILRSRVHPSLSVIPML